MITTITRGDIERLAGATGLCVSAYIPAAESGTGRKEGPIRLKNKLDEAHRMLVATGMRPTLAFDLLEPAAKLSRNVDFWMDVAPGVAVFLHEGEFRVYRVPYPVPELVVVGSRHHLLPLMPVLNEEAAYVLALDEQHVRLLLVNHELVRPIHVLGMPGSLAEALGPEYSEKQRQLHTVGASGRMGSVSHGAGDRAADTKDRDLRFAQAVDRALTKHLARSKAPLILAGSDPLLSVYRNASHYSHVERAAIEGSPQRKSDDDLAADARVILADLAHAKEDKAMDLYFELEAMGRGLRGVEALVPASIGGRVETLYVKATEPCWGFVKDGGAAEPCGSEQPWAEDLINRAAVETLAHGGHVRELPDHASLREDTVVGALRY